MSANPPHDHDNSAEDYLLSRYARRRLFLTPDHQPLIISHRGSGRSHRQSPFPENTLPAVVNAWESGFDCVEVDLRLTRDRVPILMHDRRAPMRGGGSFPVDELDYADLEGAALARGTACPDPRVAVPSLDIVLGLTRDQAALRPRGPVLHIDIKLEPDLGRTLEAAEAAVEMTKRFGLVHRVIFSTLSGPVSDLIRSRAPEAFIYYASIFRPFKGFKLAQVHGVDAFGTCHAWTFQTLVRKVQNAGMCFVSFLPAHEFHLRRMIRMGVDAVVTDRPMLLRRILRGPEPSDSADT